MTMIQARCFICRKVIAGVSEPTLLNERLAHRECLDRIMLGPGISPEVREEYLKVVSRDDD